MTLLASFNVAMAVVTADFDRAVTEALRRCRVELIHQGTRGEDLETMLDFQRDQLEAWREESLADLRAWLLDQGTRQLH